MIHEAVVIMTILGCGDHEMDCHYIPAPSTTWQSEAECNAAIPRVLGRLEDAPYPLLTASCEARHAASEDRQADFPADGMAPPPSVVSGAGSMDKPAAEPNTFEVIRARASADLGVVSGARTAIDYVYRAPGYLTGKVYDLVTWD